MSSDAAHRLWSVVDQLAATDLDCMPDGARLDELRALWPALCAAQAQIARQTQAYQERPKRKFVGARAQEDRFAMYVDNWRLRVERIGNLNYPAEAKARPADSPTTDRTHSEMASSSPRSSVT